MLVEEVLHPVNIIMMMMIMMMMMMAMTITMKMMMTMTMGLEDIGGDGCRVQPISPFYSRLTSYDQPASHILHIVKLIIMIICNTS